MAKQETQIETITMEDGRVVDFAGKRKLQKTSIIADGKVQVRLDFRNGQTRLFTVPPAIVSSPTSRWIRLAYPVRFPIGDPTHAVPL